MNRRAASFAAVGLLLSLGVLLALLVPAAVTTGDLTPAAAGFTAQQVAREVAFHDALRPTSYAALVLGLVVAAVLGLTPLGARLVGRLARGWFLQVLLGTLVLTAVGRLVVLPLSVRNERLLREFGLSTLSWQSWAVDLVKQVAVDAALTALALLAVVGLARRTRHWWAWAALSTAGLVAVGSFVYPLVIEPIFNDVRPLAPGALREDLLALAERDGVPVKDVLVADASRRTTALNAYVSGFGSTRRIVVYDTLVVEAPPAEVALVVAHELGHADADDVRNGTLLGAVGAAAAVCVLALLLSWPPLLRRAGVIGVGDARVVALLLLLVAVGTQVAGPGANLVSRRIEARADVHALELTGDAATFERVQRRLALTNLSDLEPNSLAYALFSTHPSATERIALARRR